MKFLSDKMLNEKLSRRDFRFIVKVTRKIFDAEGITLFYSIDFV